MSKDPDDDLRLFREKMSGVRRIETDRAPDTRRRPSPRARFTRADERQVLEDSLTGAPYIDAHEELSYRRPGVGAAVLRRLRRGRYSISSELDLHGLTATEARVAIDEFIAECLDHGYRCVRIIHGKGTRSGGSGPVLKPLVASWLRRRNTVLAFTTAPARDGGGGALYVLLRS